MIERLRRLWRKYIYREKWCPYRVYRDYSWWIYHDYLKHSGHRRIAAIEQCIKLRDKILGE